MSRASAVRRLTAVALSTTAFAGTASAQAADEPILGFSEDAAQAQRAYEDRFQRGVNPDVIGRTSRALSRRPQLIATPGGQRSLEYSARRLRSYGLDVSTPGYGVYSSRPRDVSVTMTAPYTRRLANKERGFPWQQQFDDVVVGYNAYSPSGDVSGEVVYANYGLPEDYAELERLGVDVRGKIVLVRYGGSFRGVKAQQAEERGAKGVLIYSDPEDDGFTRGPVYPDGPWRPADGIQRGSIQYIFQYPGDPLPPGEPSVPGTRRIAPEDAGNLPRIPTTPISYGDAQPLLEAARRAAGARVLPGRAADRLPGGARRHAGAARPRHRVRADAGAQRARRDPGHQQAGGAGRHRRPLRRLDLRHQRQHERLDHDHGDRPQPRAPARPRLAARAHDRARRLGW